MTQGPLGVLLMAYGTPDDLSDVEAYFTDIRGGRPPSAEAVAELKERYIKIGGRSPLKEITLRQAKALEVELNHPPALPQEVRVYVGMKHWHPTIEEALSAMASDGVAEAVALILAPQASRLSSATYMQKVADYRAKAAPHLTIYPVESWHLEPGFIQALSRRIQELQRPSSTPLVVTAHSLPERLRTWDDPYPKQLEEMARVLARRSGHGHVRVAYQSASATGEPWLGPDILEVLTELKEEGAQEVIVCPAGFVADHLEILYDLDIEAREKARELGLSLYRTESLNDDPLFIEGLAHVVQEAFNEGWAGARAPLP